MNLYKVTGKSYTDSQYPEIKYILAITESVAVHKFIDIINNKNKSSYIKCEYVCKRDDIIPTVEPIKELNHDS